jgi:hypothetical protein
MTVNKEAPPGKPTGERPQPKPTDTNQVPTTGTQHHQDSGREKLITSRQVDWWRVHEYVAAALAAAGSWPMVGTPAWCALDDCDPAKTAALLDAARHWALRVDACQEAEWEASREISASADWAAISRYVYKHAQFYAARPWLRRAS